MFENSNEIWNWFHWKWFDPKFLQELHWENPIFLYIIPAIPLLYLIRGIINFGLRQKLDIALFPGDNNRSSIVGTIRFIPYLFFIAFITFILIALARPQESNKRISFSTDGVDIIYLLDISESMLLEDLKPTRLEASKKILKSFTDKRSNDRIGLVVFSGQAYSLSPLTSDYDLVKNYIDDVNFNLLDTGSTAIGNAIITGLNKIKSSDSKSKIIVLLTDGDNTSGNIGPEMAAKLCNAFNVKVYSIGVGTNGDIPFGKDSLGNTQYVKSVLNEGLLHKIATLTRGKYFRATNNNSLKHILDQIDKMERGNIIETKFKDVKDYYSVYLIWGVIFFLFWMFAKNTFLTNALED